MIVDARLKAKLDLAIMIGWQGEKFARTPRIKPLGEYLKATGRPDPDTGAADLRDMISRRARKQGGR